MLMMCPALPSEYKNSEFRLNIVVIGVDDRVVIGGVLIE
jgi:hypothetical protein